jgi:hypothetical protein
LSRERVRQFTAFPSPPRHESSLANSRGGSATNTSFRGFRVAAAVLRDGARMRAR